MKRSVHRILLGALALSIAVHTAVAFTVRPMRTIEARPEPTPGHMLIVHIVPPPTPKPTPPPPRPPVHANRPTSFDHPQISRPHLIATSNTFGKGPVEVGPPPNPEPGTINGGGDVATGSPVPTATPRPACSAPDVAASAVDPVQPSMPEGAPTDAVAQVEVSLDAAGNVTAAQIYRSANDLRLDRAALAAARETKYRPQIRACVPIGGSYLFTVDFQS